MAALVAAVMTAAVAIGAAFLVNALLTRRETAIVPEESQPSEAVTAQDEPRLFLRATDAGVAAVAISVLAVHASGANVPLWSGGIAVLAFALVARPKAEAQEPVWLALPLFLCAATVALRYGTWESSASMSAQAALGPAITSGSSEDIAVIALAAVVSLGLAVVWGACYPIPNGSRLNRWAAAAVCAAPALAAAPLAGPGFAALISGPLASWSYAAVSVLFLAAVAAAGAASHSRVGRIPSNRWIVASAVVSSAALTLAWLV
ncbi:MAG TPA: hypothetical protein VND22_03630 [Actinomycetota bacterium]|nr:hypothetical protein [Actinomycetota bacterium]